jgi:hypothetical protein
METLTLKLKWENAKSFEMTEDDGKTISIVKVEENGNIGVVWPHVKAICTEYFNSKVDAIGQEMAQL